MQKYIPQSKMARTGIAGIAAAKVGVGELKHKIKRPFLSDHNSSEDKEILNDKNAKILFNALTQLRGTALKVAQMLGMEQGLLPESYRKELSKSFHKVPPLNRVLVRKIMLEEFNLPAEEVYAKFESEAFAAASLGQVHKAEHIDGTKLAVKVQYPGIAASIASDMTMIRGIARGLPNTKLILQTLNEIEARLKEEVNYKIEAENTLWFEKNVTLDGISIPSIYPEFSTDKILTTSFIEGLHLEEWLETNPSQESRDQAAQLLYDFFLYSSNTLLCFHADPNPGNYLFHEDGTITVIDFGCIRRLSKQFGESFSILMKAYREDDPNTLFPAYESLGMKHANENDEFYQKVLRPFGQWVTEPIKEESYDFGNSNDYTLRGKEPMKLLHEMTDIESIAEEFVFHNRTLYGLYQIFEKMEASVKMRHPVMGFKE